MSAKIYLEYLCKVKPELDKNSERLLDCLGVEWHQNRQVTVSQAMNIVPDLSTNTAFQYLKFLRKQGYVCVSQCERDNRVKWLQITSKSADYFARRGEAMAAAAVVGGAA